MKHIFSKTPSLGIRLFFAIALSLALIAIDGRSNFTAKFRNVMETTTSGLFYVANTPRVVLDNVSSSFVDSSTLRYENKLLKTQLRKKNSELLLLEQLKVENQRLRLLLGSPLRQDEYKKIAEVLTIDIDAYRQQLVINQGHRSGVFVGQPIIDERGIIGQVISVGETTSRVLLVTDASHAIPVQVLRNDVRAILNGTGNNNEMLLENLPRTTDVKKGDVLVSSGLGGRYPEGYPVAIVQSVANQQSSQFARIVAKPLASFEHLRYLLLLWPTSTDLHKADTLSPQDVRDAIESRRKTLNPLERLKPQDAQKEEIKLPEEDSLEEGKEEEKE